MIAAAIGWLGTLGSISAYLMLSRGNWASSSIRYSALNCAAGLLGAFASGVYGAWPSVTSNLMWALIGGHSVLTAVRERRAAAQPATVSRIPVDYDPEPPTGPQPVLLAA